ncbi:MAG: hypothetical protein K0R68_3326 [Mycobacterium sp.]|nr:hypothetical protein [Mycobacterium sp.]
MSDQIEVRDPRVASTRTPHHKATVLRLTLAGAFVVILLGVAAASDHWSSQMVPAIFGFATAITLIALSGIGWERQVDVAESQGLVKHYDQHPAET